MPTVISRGDPSVSIHYEHHGLVDDPPLLLIAGLGNQLIFWEDEFIQGLLDRAFRVVVFDNRDTGLSTDMTNAPAYSLDDMALDALSVLDALEIDRAHVLGVSLGGLVAQTMAIKHTERVQSLTLLSSTTGGAGVGQPSPECLEALVLEGPTEFEAAIAHNVRVRELWSTTEHWDADWTEQYFRRAATRSPVVGGATRQMAATVGAAEQEPALAELDIATLVLHGTADPLIAPSGGERLAELIPGAELIMLDGMGHDLPPHYWAPVIESVTQLAIRSR